MHLHIHIHRHSQFHIHVHIHIRVYMHVHMQPDSARVRKPTDPAFLFSAAVWLSHKSSLIDIISK